MRLVALGILFLAAPAWAGEVYSFTIERRGGLDEQVRTGRVLVGGQHYRLELAPEAAPRTYDVLISKGTDGKEIGLDLANRTFYELKKKPGPDFPSSSLLRLWAMGPAKVKVSKVHLEAPETSVQETVSGLSTLRREVHIAYDLAVRYPGETVKVKVEIEVIRWLAENKALPVPGLLRPEIHAALPEVDVPLDEALAKLAGFPVKQQVTITSAIAKGTSQTQITTTTMSDFAKADTPPSLFEIPSGFRYEEPVIVRPGLSQRFPLSKLGGCAMGEGTGGQEGPAPYQLAAFLFVRASRPFRLAALPFARALLLKEKAAT